MRITILVKIAALSLLGSLTAELATAEEKVVTVNDYSNPPANTWVLIHREDNSVGKAFAKIGFGELPIVREGTLYCERVVLLLSVRCLTMPVMWPLENIRCKMRMCCLSTLGILISLLPQILCDAEASKTKFTFSRFYVDRDYGGSGKPGFVRAGDMDGDGDVDIVAGGGRALFVYENDGTPNRQDWIRHGNLDSTGNMGLNGACLHDVDGDGDLDVIGAKYRSDLGWWENPGRLDKHVWDYHKLSSANGFLHDLICADLDGDGKANEFIATLNSGGYWSSDIAIKWFRPSEIPTQLWESHSVESKRNEGRSHCHAGLDTGDVDRDGNVDIAFSNGWYEAPNEPSGNWIWHEVATTHGISNALLRDLDSDGDLDLIVSAGHHGKGVLPHGAIIT